MKANKIHKITSNFTCKQVENDEDLIIEGYASTDAVDRDGDVIPAKVWDEKALSNYNKNSILLFNHNWNNPIGKATEISATDKGLYIAAKISKTAGNIYELIKEGVLKAFSASFMINDAEYKSDLNLFVIKEVELFEVSVVSIPANPEAIFDIRKSFETDEEYNAFKNKYKVADPAEEKRGENKMSDNLDIKDALKEQEQYLTKVFDEKLSNITSAIEAKSGAEKALEDMQAKLLAAEEKAKASSDEAATYKEEVEKSLSEMKSTLEEKNEEIKALTEKKNLWEKQKTGKQFTDEEIDTAIIVAKSLGRPIDSTDYFKGLAQKTPVSAHLSDVIDEWEQGFSTRMEKDIRQRLVVEPLFRQIAMNATTMHYTIDPEAGVGTWVHSSDYTGATTDTSGKSTGDSVLHKPSDETMIAYKLATKEPLGYEEEEDSIIALAPMIRDAVTRRMARTSEIAILRGTGVTSAGNTFDPITGLTKVANDASKSVSGADRPSPTSRDFTVSTLGAMRKLMGVWGVTPSDVVYVVSVDAYYDLLEDPDFRTTDMVGTDRATILNGQIGTVMGSRVLVSGEFESTATSAYAAIAVNTSNFVVGNRRFLMLERDKDVLNQKNWLVATRRMAFRPIIPSQAVAAVAWN